MTNEELNDMNIRLKKMIKRTGRMLAEIVDTQRDSIPLYYSNEVQYLSMVRQKDADGDCRGVLWKRYRPSRNGRIWLSGWSIDKTPVGSLTKRMDANGRMKFQEMHDLAKAVNKARKDLISKKRRIQATAQAIRDFETRHMKKVEKKRNEFFID